MENDQDNREDSGSLLRGPVAEGAQPERVTTADNARRLITSAADNVSYRLDEYRMVADAYDRMPPDTEDRLRSDGLGWAANVNWGGLEADIDGAASPLIKLLTEPHAFVKLRADDVDMRSKTQALAELAKADARMLREWPDWLYEAQLMVHNRVANGLGIFYFPHPHGWHFESLHPGNLIVPEKAPLNPEKWPWCGIISEFQVNDLLQRLSDPETSESQGWNLAAIRQAIEKYRTGDGTRWPEKLDVDRLVHGFSESRASFSTAIDDTITIKGFIFYCREYDGTISEHWITNQDGVDFLFQRKAKRRNMSHVVCMFPHGLGAGYLNNVRGLGIKVLPYHDLEDRTLNHAVDVSMLASNLMLKGGLDQINNLAELIVGPVTLIPDGYQVEQQSFANPVAGLSELRREMQATKAHRAKTFGGDIDTSPNVDRTASGARMRYQEQANLRDEEVDRFYQQITIFHRARWERMQDSDADDDDPGMSQVKQMLAEAAKRGVPEELFTQVNRITAVRMFGNGDPVNQFLAMMDVGQLRGEFTAGGRRTFARVTANARLRDTDLVDELFGSDEDLFDDVETRQRQIAQMENALFQTSDVRIDISGTDDHLIHAGEHTVFAEDTKAQLDQELIPKEQAYKTLSKAREHTLPHLQLLARDPMAEEIFKDVQRRWANLENTLRQLRQHLEAEREAEAQRKLEELRYPQPSVKDIEAAKTEQLKRDLAERESASRIKIMEQEARAKIDAMRKQATEAGEIMDLKDFQVVDVD